MNKYWAFLLAAAAIYGVLSTFLPRRIYTRRLSKRPSLSFEVIYQTYFGKAPYPKALIRSLWREAAASLRVDEGKLRPTDAFEDELSSKLFPLVDLGEDLWDMLRLRLKATPKSDWPKNVETLGQFIEEIAARSERDSSRPP